MHAIRLTAVVAITVACLLLTTAVDVRADGGGSSWGYGETWQTSYYYDCQWYDNEHDDGQYGCWRGVSSTTESNWGDGVQLYQSALRQHWGLYPGETGTYVY